MDLSPQGFIFELGWFFFSAWAVVLAALSAIIFWRDLFRSKRRSSSKPRESA